MTYLSLKTYCPVLPNKDEQIECELMGHKFDIQSNWLLNPKWCFLIEQNDCWNGISRQIVKRINKLCLTVTMLNTANILKEEILKSSTPNPTPISILWDGFWFIGYKLQKTSHNEIPIIRIYKITTTAWYIDETHKEIRVNFE